MSLIETPDFKSMPIEKLRQYASHLRVAVSKTSTKKEIIDSIERKLDGRVIPTIADSGTQLKPGYSRIRVLSDPMPGAPNSPVYLLCNGYTFLIPRDVEVIVPNRVVRTLNDATVIQKKQSLTQDSHGRDVFKDVDTVTPSYPFQILEQKDGPEVLTTLEQTKLKTAGPKMRYHKMFGRWPRPRELTRAIEQKLISLNEDEMLSDSDEKLMGVEATV